jgi:hypothetical protein
MTAMHTVTSCLQNNATANWASNNNVCCLLKRILTYACVSHVHAESVYMFHGRNTQVSIHKLKGG